MHCSMALKWQGKDGGGKKRRYRCQGDRLTGEGLGPECGIHRPMETV